MLIIACVVHSRMDSADTRWGFLRHWTRQSSAAEGWGAITGCVNLMFLATCILCMFCWYMLFQVLGVVVPCLVFGVNFSVLDKHVCVHTPWGQRLTSTQVALERYVKTSCWRRVVSIKTHGGNRSCTSGLLDWSLARALVIIRTMHRSSVIVLRTLLRVWGESGGIRMEGSRGGLAWCAQGWRAWLYRPTKVDLRSSKRWPLKTEDVMFSREIHYGYFEWYCYLREYAWALAVSQDITLMCYRKRMSYFEVN